MEDRVVAAAAQLLGDQLCDADNLVCSDRDPHSR
jgi:hypothetical protein